MSGPNGSTRLKVRQPDHSAYVIAVSIIRSAATRCGIWKVRHRAKISYRMVSFLAWVEFIVPFAMIFVADDPALRQFFVAHFASLFVGAFVQPSMDGQTRFRGCHADRCNDHLIVDPENGTTGRTPCVGGLIVVGMGGVA